MYHDESNTGYGFITENWGDANCVTGQYWAKEKLKPWANASIPVFVQYKNYDFFLQRPEIDS